MRCMVIVKATEDSESGVLPTEEDLAEMGKYNEELVKAGIMLDGAGLQSSAKGARLEYGDGGVQVTDGPFAETKELIAGYWIWEVKSFEEAIEWARRIPFAHGEGVEIRQVFEPEDFGEEYTPELQERDAALDAKIKEQRGS